MKIETPEQFIELKLESIRRVKFYVEQSNKTLGIHLPMPQVLFSLSGTTAGRAHYARNLIMFNPVLLLENAEDFLTQTAGHEVAHLAAARKFGWEIDPHGFEWQKVMWCLRLPAKRCHNYDVSNVSTRATSRPRFSQKRQITDEEGNRVKHLSGAKVIEFD